MQSRYDKLNTLNVQPYVKMLAEFLGIVNREKNTILILIKDATLTVIRLR